MHSQLFVLRQSLKIPGAAERDVTSHLRAATAQGLRATELAMSAAEETSNNSMDVKEDAEFDVEAEEDNAEDDFFGDPTRYMFYRYLGAPSRGHACWE